MRAFVLISAMVHVLLLLVAAIPYQRQTAHGETMSVELVPQNEAPAFNDDPSSSDQQQSQQQDKPKEPEAQPDFSQLRLDKPVRPDDSQQPNKSTGPAATAAARTAEGAAKSRPAPAGATTACTGGSAAPTTGRTAHAGAAEDGARDGRGNASRSG